ncbi:MAG: hypothetical protein NTZ97_00800 [Candidatus Moranbacteria bacterium]|nr:hypothetical protein [Candidatus Moranbacteria bacterium]
MKKTIIWTIVILVVLFFLMMGPFITPGSILMLKDYLTGQDAKDQKILEEIVESIKPAAARNYQFHNPSAEAQKRTIDCTKLSAFQSSLPIVNPICLNLYRTTPAEINKKIAEGKNDRVILYGENIIWDAPILKDNIEPGWDLGKAIYDSAKFTDQITVPKLLKLYGFTDASFVNALTPNKVYPFSALYYRLGNEEEVQKVCISAGSKERAAGCALGMWSTIVPQTVMGEKMSLSNQKIWRITDDKNPDYLAFDYHWPANCITDGVLIHETAHLMLYAQRVNNLPDALVSSRYFNEHQAEVMSIVGTNFICGDGSVSNFRDKNKKPISLFEFNSVYPPTKMGSAWPDVQKTCELGLINEWNRFMAKGNFETQFMAFISALKNWMKQGKTISDDKGFYNFLIQLRNDPDAKNSLQYHNCQF